MSGALWIRSSGGAVVYLVSSYAFTSLVSPTVIFGIWCFMFPTLDRGRPRHDSGEEFASSYQPLSKPSLLAPPTNPGTELMPASAYQLPPPIGTFPRSLHFLSLQTGLSMDVLFIILPMTWSYPFSHSVGSSIRHRVAIAVFCSRSVPVFSILCPNRCFSARLWACWLGCCFSS